MKTSVKDTDRMDRVLEKHALKKTPLRRSILLAMEKAGSSLSQADLIAKLSKDMDSVDRVSIYRNLNQLKEAGVLHEVDVNSYVFCSHECEAHAHLLLFCQKCHQHQEIKDHARIEQFMAALGTFRFFSKDQPIFLKGVCTNCA